MKITIGLTTWTEHPALINNEQRPVTLNEYAQHLPTVEVDTFFYALPQVTTIQNWLAEVPESFQFIVKTHRRMTLHERGQEKGELEQLFNRYRKTVAPLVAAGQLKTVLFQFPPYFDASPQDIEYLRLVRLWMGNLPIAIELRNQTWYRPGTLKSLLAFCRELHFTLVAADEPHGTVTSVPFVLATTNPDLVMMRLHGQNTEGWINQGKSWRKTRTLYKYSSAELQVFCDQINQLTPQPKELCVVFNNNSGKDAAPNALQLQKMLGIHFTGLAPRSPEQIDLF
ncbi:MAG: DUF72 domain-containing protein [Lactobacillaceae bacterium]|uniref:DUF72 domain-containing protein n=1 Tax=Limosilactobacillus sp. TaxID=2773925 RepID=UPI002A75BC78|nr:DUF72 domain-containing protein [Limosilactobacillus sp.]MDD7692770.1 DUF72 domain-containing protein [Lactobacillaceae bacterium]MDY2803279.1 DUF72 domain-containing protein [Limosilactobacillus sp.]